MIQLIIYFIILLIIFYILNYLYKSYINNNYNIKNTEYFDNKEDLKQDNSSKSSMGDRVIWMYWETLPGKTKPGYIDLCIESVKFNCGRCFDVIVLDNITILDYLPELKDLDLTFLHLPQRVDYYRYSLLEKYGGVWIDADILVLKCICPFYNKLKKHDYVGFGCGHEYDICQRTLHGYSKPLNWFMMSRPHTKFIKCVKSTTESRIVDALQNNRELEYHEIGKDVLEHCYREMMNDNDEWDYGHIPSKCQEYDSSGNVLDNIMIDFNWQDCKGKRIFFPLYNTAPGYPDWFRNLTAQELKNSDSYLRPIINAAYEKKKTCYELNDSSQSDIELVGTEPFNSEFSTEFSSEFSTEFSTELDSTSNEPSEFIVSDI